MSELRVLFEDEHLIAVVKPYSVLSQGNENVRSLCDDISDYLTSKGEKGDVYVIHRLDKTTGGVMVYAKSKEVAAKMSVLIQNGGFSKEYHAVVQGVPKENSGRLCDLLYHDKAKNKTYVVKRNRKGVKEAELLYSVMGTATYKNEDVTKVSVKLMTGRTHQIRVQFASRRHPLVGDRKYGSAIADNKIALWSYRISFVHPMNSEPVEVMSEVSQGAFSAF